MWIQSKFFVSDAAKPLHFVSSQIFNTAKADYFSEENVRIALALLQTSRDKRYLKNVLQLVIWTGIHEYGCSIFDSVVYNVLDLQLIFVVRVPDR